MSSVIEDYPHCVCVRVRVSIRPGNHEGECRQHWRTGPSGDTLGMCLAASLTYEGLATPSVTSQALKSAQEVEFGMWVHDSSGPGSNSVVILI